MKLSKKFIEDLHKIGEDAFIEKNQWIGKLVPDIIIDNLKKRGINQGDLEGVVCLTVEESKRISMFFGAVDCCSSDIKLTEGEKNLWKNLNERIEQAEMSKQSTQCENVSKKDEKIIILTVDEAEKRE